jgi:hypothetical protein
MITTIELTISTLFEKWGSDPTFGLNQPIRSRKPTRHSLLDQPEIHARLVELGRSEKNLSAREIAGALRAKFPELADSISAQMVYNRLVVREIWVVRKRRPDHASRCA